SRDTVYVSEELIAGGYLTSPQTIAKAKRMHWVIGLVVLVGAFRLLNGMSLGRPVSYLVLSLIATVLLWAVMLAYAKAPGPFRTGRGSAALAQARSSVPRDEPVDRAASANMAGIGILAPIALYGLTAYPDLDLSGMVAQTH